MNLDDYDDLKLPDQLESEVEGPAVEYAESRGWFCAKFVSPGLRGVMDRIFIRDGRVLFVEFKRPGKRPRTQQKKRIAEMIAHGAEVHSIDNLNDAFDLFR
jgi:hypothetical protein